MFKPGDKVYHYTFGIVELEEGPSASTHPLKVCTPTGILTFTREGKGYLHAKYPILITLEEAEKRGFVRKKVTIRGLRVKYWDTRFPCYSATCRGYESREDFEQRADLDCKFISFVDEKLNECDPPKETIEWEEI
jgi:hypothetical protein